MNKVQNRSGGSREIPVKVVREFSLSDDTVHRQRIAEKAYELYQCRGCGCGRDLDDWLEAERLILSEIESGSHGRVQNTPGQSQQSKKR